MSVTLVANPRPTLDWLTDGEPASSNPVGSPAVYPAVPGGVSNRPLYQLLQNDTQLFANLQGLADQLEGQIVVLQAAVAGHEGTNWQTAHPGASTDFGALSAQVTTILAQIGNILPVYVRLTRPGYMKFANGLTLLWFEDQSRSLRGFYGAVIPWPMTSVLDVKATPRSLNVDITANNNTTIQESGTSPYGSGGLLILNYSLLNANASFPNIAPMFLVVAQDANNGITATNQAPAALGPFNLTVTNGSFTGTNPLAVGTTVPITANAPGMGYAFGYWNVTVGDAVVLDPNSSSTYATVLSAATLVPIYYSTGMTTVVVTVVNGSITWGNNPFNQGTAVQISANAAPAGYVFSTWVLSSGTGTFGSAGSASTTITPTTNVTVTATYTAIATHSLTVTGGTFSGSNPFQQGIPIAIAANTPPTGQVFNGWTVATGSATIANASYQNTTVTLTTDATVVASFISAPTVSLTVNGGFINSGANPFAIGATVGITANAPASGYLFQNWTVTSGSISLINSTSAVASAVVNTTGSVTANYTPTPTVHLTVNNGTITSGVADVLPGTVDQVTANAAPAGFVFDHWTLVSGNTTFANPTSAVTNVTVYTASTVAAVYAAIPNITVTVVNGTGGGSFPPSSAIGINANSPAYNRRFKNWTITSGSATIYNASLAMTNLELGTGNVTVTANYEPTFWTNSFNALGSLKGYGGSESLFAGANLEGGSNCNIAVTVTSLSGAWQTMVLVATGTNVSVNQTFGAGSSQEYTLNNVGDGALSIYAYFYGSDGNLDTIQLAEIEVTITSGTEVFNNVSARANTNNLNGVRVQADGGVEAGTYINTCRLDVTSGGIGDYRFVPGGNFDNPGVQLPSLINGGLMCNGGTPELDANSLYSTRVQTTVTMQGY